ncbi:MAG: hypothetical protein NVSMB4_08770 [Acidimicrobiales bacterium]
MSTAEKLSRVQADLDNATRTRNVLIHARRELADQARSEGMTDADVARLLGITPAMARRLRVTS